MTEYIIRRRIITDFGRFDFPNESATAAQRKLEIEHFINQGFSIDLESQELDVIEFSKLDNKGNLMIVSIDKQEV